MAILNFDKQFAADVETGYKRQTIRAERKRPIKKGEKLYLYTALRTKQARLLRCAFCLAADGIEIRSTGKVVVYLKENQAGITLTDTGKEGLARADGFKGPDAFGEMLKFFREKHGLPFFGQLIKW